MKGTNDMRTATAFLVAWRCERLTPRCTIVVVALSVASVASVVRLPLHRPGRSAFFAAIMQLQLPLLSASFPRNPRRSIHDAFSALVGSTRVARRAGMMLARRPAIPGQEPRRCKVAGSVAVTPKKSISWRQAREMTRQPAEDDPCDHELHPLPRDEGRDVVSSGAKRHADAISWERLQRGCEHAVPTDQRRGEVDGTEHGSIMVLNRPSQRASEAFIHCRDVRKPAASDRPRRRRPESRYNLRGIATGSRDDGHRAAGSTPTPPADLRHGEVELRQWFSTRARGTGCPRRRRRPSSSVDRRVPLRSRSFACRADSRP